ncbi:unnamed protein product [Camellia sinensis]
MKVSNAPLFTTHQLCPETAGAPVVAGGATGFVTGVVTGTPVDGSGLVVTGLVIGCAPTTVLGVVTGLVTGTGEFTGFVEGTGTGVVGVTVTG